MLTTVRPSVVVALSAIIAHRGSGRATVSGHRHDPKLAAHPVVLEESRFICFDDFRRLRSCETVAGCDSGLGFTATEEFGPMHIEGGQIRRWLRWVQTLDVGVVPVDDEVVPTMNRDGRATDRVLPASDKVTSANHEGRGTP